MAKKKNTFKFTPPDNNLNAATDAWIPVQTLEGKFEKASLIDVFSKNYISFAGDAVEQYCLMRLCEAIAHSHPDNQPNSIGELIAIKTTFAQNAVEYLKDNVELFNFRGNKPFLQCTAEESKSRCLELGFAKWEPKPIQLREEYACGNNTVVIQSSVKKYLTVSETLLDLLVQQVFGVTFGKTKAIPSRALVFSNSTHGNLNIFIKADTLINSVWANMAYGVEWGHTIFERSVDTSTYLNRLVPQTVYINISEDLNEMYYCKGLDYLDLETDSSHIKYETNKNGKELETRPIKTGESFKYWNAFATMVLNDNRPIQLERTDRRFSHLDFVDVVAIGSLFKASMGVYYTIDSIASARCLKHPSKIETPQYKTYLEKIVKISNTKKEAIKSATYSIFNESNPNIISEVTSLFWDFLDIRSQIIFDAEGTDDDVADWGRVIHDAISNCYSHILKKAGYLKASRFLSRVNG